MYVGVILTFYALIAYMDSIPHVRGGDPRKQYSDK